VSNIFDFEFGSFQQTPHGSVPLAGPLDPNAGIFPGQPPIQGATLGAGSQGNVLATPGASSLPNSTISNPTAQAPVNAAAAQASAPTLEPGSLGDYFARAIIIVLGFIFVAIGLNMLRPGTVPTPGFVKP
jgi:hypothetical protein